MNKTLQELKQQLEEERRASCAFAELSRAIISPLLTRSEVYQMVLDQARELTNSEYGFVSSIDPQSGAHVSRTLTMMKADEGIFREDPHGQFGGLWGKSLNTWEAFFTNSPLPDSVSRGIKTGHAHLKNFLSVPIVFHGLLLGQIALANSTRDYTQTDIENIEKLAVFYAVTLRTHLWEKALQEANETLEHKVETRTQELMTVNATLAAQYEEILVVQEKNATLNQELTAMNENMQQLAAEKAEDILSINQKLIEKYVELAQAERKLRRNAEIQMVLREIAEAAIWVHSMNELYASVHRLVGRVLPVTKIHINLLDEATGEIFTHYCADGDNLIPAGRSLDKEMTEYIMRIGRAVHVTPAEMDRLSEADGNAQGRMPKMQLCHYLGAPLINSAGKPFGVLALISMGNYQVFQPEDVEIFSIIAAQVSMAIERKRGQVEIRTAKEQFEMIFNTGPDGALITRLDDGVIVNISEGFTTLTGWTSEECAGKSGLELNFWKNDDDWKQLLKILDEKGYCSNFEAAFQKKDGTEIIGLLSAKATKINERPHVISVIRDITDRKRMEKELQLLATTDGLTGIFNRRHFLSRAEKELQRMTRYGGTCSLLMLDIDHFKRVNDSFGHAVGDAAIQRIAKLCAESLRSTDFLGRIGGEEFAMLLLETGISEAEQFAERLRRRIQDDPFGEEQGVSCPLQVSIGAANRQHNDETLAALMIRADEALYRAKREGRNKVVTA